MKCKFSNIPVNADDGGSSTISPTYNRIFSDQEIRDLYGKRFYAIGRSHDEFVSFLSSQVETLKQGNSGAQIVLDKALENFIANNYDFLEQYYPYYHGGMATV